MAPLTENRDPTLSLRFGTAACVKGYVTSDQVQKALSEQLDDNVSGRPHRLLGTILKQKKLITEEQEKEILAYLDWLVK